MIAPFVLFVLFTASAPTPAEPSTDSVDPATRPAVSATLPRREAHPAPPVAAEQASVPRGSTTGIVGEKGSGYRENTAGVVGEKGSGYRENVDGIVGEKGSGYRENADGIVGEKGSVARETFVNSWESDRVTTFHHLIQDRPGRVALRLQARSTSSAGEKVSVYLADGNGARKAGWHMSLIATRNGASRSGSLVIPEAARGQKMSKVPILVVIENATGEAHSGDYELSLAR